VSALIRSIVFVSTAVACSSTDGSWNYGKHDGGDNNNDGNRGQNVDANTADANLAMGGPLVCPSPGSPKPNGGSCGTDRWSIKVGTDSQAHNIALVAHSNTIAALAALPAPPTGSSTRDAPTETTIYELKNVVLTELKLESDSDYHLVLSDGGSPAHTLIAEIPYQSCVSGTAWACFISKARSDVDARFPQITGFPQYPAQTVTVRGVGFFDTLHSQTGVAPNAIELHPVLEVCFGKDCGFPQ
jgi:hypothetical protein